MIKKVPSKKLAPSTLTVRDLRDGDLRVVAGGTVIVPKSIDSNCPPPKQAIE